jgi:TIR domain
MTDKNPVVLISYSHDSLAHLDRVLTLSNKLRTEGIDCILDQYEESPSEGWPRWMEKNIRIADFVLLVCTQTYYNRVMGLEEEGVGLGVKWEGHLIYQHLYNAGTINNKFIPVIFSDGSNSFVPTPIQSATIYNVDNSSEYDRLYWRLRGVTKQKPELGKLRPVPEKERKTMFVGGFIDVELWNKAGWKGVVYAHDQANREPPIMAILFTNEEAARKIFEGWRKRLGEYDTYNELRISIVEGDVEDEPYGYYIHISSYIENIIKHLKEKNPNSEFDLFMLVSRIHRMNPDPTSKNLALFKERFKLFNSYVLIPGILNSENKIKLIEELRVLKRNVELRQFTDITTKNDPDSVLNKKFIKEIEDNK